MNSLLKLIASSKPSNNTSRSVARTIGDVRRSVHGRWLHERDFLHLLAKHLKTGVGHTCICGKAVPNRRRQALLERSGAAGVDVDLVTLQPMRIGTSWPFFVHGNTEAALPKALGKTQAADPASNDDHVKSHGRSIGLSRAHTSSLNDFAIVAASTASSRK